MPTVTKLFPFASTTEGWVATATTSTLTANTTTGNPAGCLSSALSVNAREVAYWEWTGTWETLGVPTGQVVTFVRLNSEYDKCTSGGGGGGFAPRPMHSPAGVLQSGGVLAPPIIGPFEVYDNTPTLKVTLVGTRQPSAAETAWTQEVGNDQPVPLSISPSNTTIRLRISNTMNSTGTLCQIYNDQAQYVITYQPPGGFMRRYPPKPHSGQANIDHDLYRGLQAAMPFIEMGGSPRNHVNRTLPAFSSGSMTWNRQGKMGVALDGGAINNSNWLGWNSAVAVDRKNCSLEAWVMFRSFAGATPFVSSIMYTGGGLKFRCVNNKVEVTDGVATLTSNNMLATGVLYQVVVVSSGGQLYLYVNGQLDGSVSTTLTSSTFRDVYVNRDDQVSGRGTDGIFECARVWNRALQPSEVSDLYENPWAVYYIPRNVETSKAFFTSTSAISATHPTIAASASFVIPVYHGTMASTATHPAISSSAGVVAPNYHGTMASTATHATVTAIAKNPFKANASPTATHATIAAAAHFVVPVYTANSATAATHATVAAAAHESAIYTGNAALTAAHATIAASANLGLPVYHGTSAVTASHATIASSATCPAPAYHGNASLTATHATVSTNAHEAAIYTGSAAVTAAHVTMVASSSLLVPAYHGSTSLSSQATFAASAHYTIPAYRANVAISVAHPTFAAAGTMPVRFATVAVTTTHQTMTASAHYVIPAYGGNAALSRAATFVSAGHFAPPVYHGTAAVTAAHPTFTAAGVVGPNEHIVTKGYGYGQRIVFHGYFRGIYVSAATSVVTVTHPTMAASGYLVVPAYIGNSSMTATHAVFSSFSAAATTYTGNASLMNHPTLSVNSHEAAIYTGNASLTSAHATASSSGHSAAPAYTGNAAVTVTHPTTSASGHFEIIIYVGNASLSKQSTFTASGHNTVPAYAGSASLTAAHATISSSATKPQFAATSAMVIGDLIFSASAHSAIPRYTTNPVPTISHPTISSSGHIVVPAYTGNSVTLTKQATFSSSGKYAPPAYAANVSLVASHATIASSGQSIIPVYTGNAALTASHAVLATSSHESAIYEGVAMLTAVGVVFSAAGVGVTPTYHGVGDVTTSNAVADASGGGNRPSFVGDANLRMAGAFTSQAHGISGRPTYSGVAGFTASNATLQAFGVLHISNLIVRGERYIANARGLTRTIRNTSGRILRVSHQPRNVVVTLYGGGPCNNKPGF